MSFAHFENFVAKETEMEQKQPVVFVSDKQSGLGNLCNRYQN